MKNLSERQIRLRLAAIGLGCFVLLLALEILTNLDEFTPFDAAVDALSILLTVGTAVGVALLAHRLQMQHEEKINLIRDLEIARAEGDGWRDRVRSHLAGLRAGMDGQFEQWGLTAAERDVALLILKGLSHKEVASLRATTEATVRQQAQSIYRKADLPGKTAFCAYFLEDLLALDVSGDLLIPSDEPTLVAKTDPAKRLPGEREKHLSRP